MAKKRRLGSSYVLDRLLGSGATGQVWAGRDTYGQPWAFKLLRGDLASDPAIVHRFIQERSLLASVRHPNVVEVHDLVVEGQTLAIVMDLIKGQDLRSLLNAEGTLPPQRVAAIGAQVATALQAAHYGGVIHRDVKPENVLIDAATGNVRLADFGIARLVDGSQRSTMMRGTPHYMAPEVAEERIPTPAVDLYSLGIMLYEMCCGITPFADRGSPMATLLAHAMDVPGRPGGVPDRLWAVIAGLTAKDPEQRPLPAAVAAELTSIAAASVKLAKAKQLTTPPRPQTSRDSSEDESAPIAKTAPMAQVSRQAGVADQSAEPARPTPAEAAERSADRSAESAPGTPAPSREQYPSDDTHTPDSDESAGSDDDEPSGAGLTGEYQRRDFSDGSTSSEDSVATEPGRRRPGALVLGAAGVLLVLLAGLGWMAVDQAQSNPAEPQVVPSASPIGSEPGQTPSGSATGSATSPAPAAASSGSATSASTSSSAKPVPAESEASSAASQGQAQPDPATRRSGADQLVRTYLTAAYSRTLTKGQMAEYFAPTVRWYGSARLTRDQVWSKIQADLANQRTFFSDPQFRRFVPNVSHNGETADRIEYLVGYSTRNRQGQEVHQGTVNVSYVLVGGKSGVPRIAEVFES